MMLVQGTVPGSLTVDTLPGGVVRFRLRVADRSLDAQLDIPREQARELARAILSDTEEAPE